MSQEANKRLSIKRLPPVLSIQFKVSFLLDHARILVTAPRQRFEQRGSDTYKIDTPVRVPLSINMAPYTTAAIEGGGT